eukprot:2144693-Rhodomonas_salina.2
MSAPDVAKRRRSTIRIRYPSSCGGVTCVSSRDMVTLAHHVSWHHHNEHVTEMVTLAHHVSRHLSTPVPANLRWNDDTMVWKYI